MKTLGNHRSEYEEGKSETSPYILLIGISRKFHADRMKYNYIRKMVHDSSEVMLAADTLPDFLRQQLNKSSMDVTDICSCQLITSIYRLSLQVDNVDKRSQGQTC